MPIAAQKWHYYASMFYIKSYRRKRNSLLRITVWRNLRGEIGSQNSNAVQSYTWRLFVSISLCVFTLMPIDCLERVMKNNVGPCSNIEGVAT